MRVIMSAISSMGPQAGVANISGMSTDFETALQQVQSTRSQLIENQLKSQLQTVADSNQKMQDLQKQQTDKSTQINQLQSQGVADTKKLADLQDLQSRLTASKCPDDNGWYGLSYGQGDNAAASYATLQQVKDAGVSIPTGANAPRDIDHNGTLDAKGSVVKQFISDVGKKIDELKAKMTNDKQTVSNLTTDITTIKGQIDSVSNNQQMDMLRLQSLMTKRSEATDLMTNTMKSSSDHRSNIISNLK